MDLFASFSELPAILKVAVPILLILFIGAIVRRVMKVVIIIGLVILFIMFVYPLFDY